VSEEKVNGDITRSNRSSKLGESGA